MFVHRRAPPPSFPTAAAAAAAIAFAFSIPNAYLNPLGDHIEELDEDYVGSHERAVAWSRLILVVERSAKAGLWDQAPHSEVREKYHEHFDWPRQRAAHARVRAAAGTTAAAVAERIVEGREEQQSGEVNIFLDPVIAHRAGVRVIPLRLPIRAGQERKGARGNNRLAEAD